MFNALFNIAFLFIYLERIIFRLVIIYIFIHVKIIFLIFRHKSLCWIFAEYKLCAYYFYSLMHYTIFRIYRKIKNINVNWISGLVRMLLVGVTNISLSSHSVQKKL